jgi:hypothetical protein
MTPKPATIANTLLDKINTLHSTLSSYLLESSFDFKRLHAEADKLDATERSVVLANLYALTGNREQIDFYLNNAQRLHADIVTIDLSYIDNLIRLGYFSEAIPFIKACGDPERGIINLLLSSTAQYWMLHLMADFYQTAKSMNLMNTPEFSPKYSAIEIMDYWGDTDADYSAVFDIAGEVMRHRKLFFRQVSVEPISEPADGSPPYIEWSFLVPIDLDTSIDMTCEYVDILARSRIKIPQSLIFEFQPSSP